MAGFVHAQHYDRGRAIGLRSGVPVLVARNGGSLASGDPARTAERNRFRGNDHEGCGVVSPASWRNNATVTLAPLSGGPYETREFQASSLPAAHDIINWRLDREWSGYMAISVVFVETS